MAATGTPTPNIGLRIPIGTDPASVDDINYNSNLIDTKLGPVGSDSVQDQIDNLNSNLTQKANYSVPTIFGYAAGITSHNLQARRVGNVIFLSGYFECISIAENTPLFFVSGIDMATFGVVEQYQGRPYSVRIASNGGLETNEALSGNTYYVNLCIPVSGN